MLAHGPPHHKNQAMQPNPILYGRDPISSIVAVEINNGQEAQVYRRLGDHIEKTACPFTPFLLLSEISL
ncbi:MAG: hypothetical protein L0Y56_01230, partial [Nitrospira sp.]|nr:hypothetical protein [Nitrospira sp.]